ncbi:hypothetical protein, partial [Escherichia coli]|uniref:hypothetical protein n=1 Tax=Escherichia coli TaxID=562 RepID=UPI0007E914AB
LSVTGKHNQSIPKKRIINKILKIHGAGCLPVNSAMTRQNPLLATLANATQPDGHYAPPLRGIHHAGTF